MPQSRTSRRAEEQVNSNLEKATHIQGILALTQGAVENLGGLDKAQKLIESGKFQTVYNGVNKTWSLNFYGNKSVEASFVTLSKESYMAKAATGASVLKCVKFAGGALNVVGVGIAGVDMYNNGVNASNSADMFFSGVAFVPPYGWLVSSSYYFGRYIAYPMGQGLKEYNESHPLEGHPENLIYHICFKSGTLVDTKSGLKEIETLKVGDSVYTWSFENQKVELTTITKKYQNTTKGIYKITTTNETINVTEDHPIYVINKGWIKVKDLQVNDKLELEEIGNKTSIIAIEKYSEQINTVYNIEVGKNHNYFITKEKILVHNKSVE